MSETHDDHPTSDLSPYALRVQALETLLAEKGVFTLEEVRQEAERMDARSPQDGARIVARAWVDAEFKARLLSDPKATLDEIGHPLPNDPNLVVLENTETLHHLVVCTLCSCYPRTLLGRPPDWYKSLAYRSRAVVDPRGVIKEFGLELPSEVEIRVADSTADKRYMVLPQRPPGTEHLGEEELAKLVSRDCLIGVANPHSALNESPSPAPAD